MIPIHVDGPDTATPKRARKQRAEPAVRATGKRDAPAAAVRVQALRGSGRARAAAAEVLMKMLLRLDAVRGAREYRRRVTRRVLALQDAVDALEQPPKAAPAVPEEEAMAEAAAADEAAQDREVASVLAPQDSVVDAVGTKGTVPEVVAEEAEATGAEATVVETAEETGESTTESSDADAAEDTSVIELKAAAEMEANLDDGKPDCCDAEWEMVAEETAEAEPAAAASPDEAAAAPQEPAGQETTTAADAGAAGPVDMGKVMEMVAALCEQNAQQCAVIAALAERVIALERAVRRAEDAERRRRRAKKLRKEGKGSSHGKCYSDANFTC